jgi:4,5-DOPA dioxygenase extradiol
MNRRGFISTLTLAPLALSAMDLSDLRNLSSGFSASDRMPVLFVGHGSPMNGIENNDFSKTWQSLPKQFPKPSAILCISAHWLTKGTLITAMDNPKTIHDFGGFPDALYQVQYPAPGHVALAQETAQLVKKTQVGLDHDWGLDHGAWTVIRHMYPDASIPVLQFSIDYHKPASYHYELAKELSALRDKGVLILGSGNMVHNLRMVAWDKMNIPNYGFDWAIEMNDLFKQKIADGDHQPLLKYESLHKAAMLAIPTPDHYWPLIYTLGLQQPKEEIKFFNDSLVAGSLTMTSVRIG